MDPVFIYFIGGLVAGVGGSFVAARLLGVEKHWNPTDQYPPDSIARTLVQAARVHALTGPSGLVSLAASTEHPLLAAALKGLVSGQDAAALRESLEATSSRKRALARRFEFAGRLMGQFAPILGITGMGGAMYLALSRLQDPTASASGFAVALLLLMVGGNVIALFGRKLTKPTPATAAAAQLSASLIIEGVYLIRSGHSAERIEAEMARLLGEPTAAGASAQAA